MSSCSLACALLASGDRPMMLKYIYMKAFTQDVYTVDVVIC